MNRPDPSRTPQPARRPAQQPALPSSPSSKVSKVAAQHTDRLAIVYVRQSTPQQIFNNRESTDLQYALDQRAVQLGWPAERVEIIDEDQGQSGSSAEGRTGFQSLLGRIAQNQVGIVLGREMSRLARSCKDWHQLLEVCALFGTLLADADGVYDPTDYNDRLLLGLKGTMSEAELHILRARMYQGMLNKAKRGEAYNHPPIGYVKSPMGGFALDPDEQVQSVVRLIFEQFDRLGTVAGLLRELVEQGIRIPVRPASGIQRDVLVWRRPNRVTLQTLLHHPIYAGYYRWGHRAVDPRKKVPGRRQSGRTCRAAKDCLVLLEDHCPAYIGKEQYWSNQQRLDANRTTRLGAARHGPALLGGLLVCGRCGYRMSVNYNDSGRHLRYACSRAFICYGEPHCQSFSGQHLDELVATLVLAALQPATLLLHLEAAADIERQRATLHKNWQQQIERADYAVDRAARQYQAVEPENRLVARELERRWEAALAEQSRLKQEYERFCHSQPAKLSAAQQEQIRQLSTQIPDLWGAETTTAADRQRLVRLLVEKVVAEVQGDSEQVEVTIHWQGGGISRHELVRGVQRYEQLADYQRLCARIDELRREGKSMDEVAACLNAEGFHPPKRVERFSGGMVSGFLERRCGKGSGRGKGSRGKMDKREWLLGDLARHLGMPAVTLHRWRKAGWVQAQTGGWQRAVGHLGEWTRETPSGSVAPPSASEPQSTDSRGVNDSDYP